MGYKQLTSEERYMIAQLKWQGWGIPDIAEIIGRHRSTVWRELKRNLTTHDGGYRAEKAQQYAVARRRRSRRNKRIPAEGWRAVEALLKLWYSPEQISATLEMERICRISHETIYQHVWRDKSQGGSLYRCLRQANKLRRKRYRGKDSRGWLAGKPMIDQRPANVEERRRFGHWEIDTVLGKAGTSACILTLVERKTGYLLIGKLDNRSVSEINRRLLHLMARESAAFRTITADNGSEFHGYKDIEAQTGTTFYFAQPYHSWERGSNENTNGLIRQYLPKGTSFEHLTQHQCNAIANALNTRPRKRYGFRTPKNLYLQH